MKIINVKFIKCKIIIYLFIYYSLFIILCIFNFFFLVICITTLHTDDFDKNNNFIFYYQIFCTSIFTFLLICTFFIINSINKSIKSSYMEEEKIKFLQEKIMKKQLLLLSMISFISSIYQLLFNILRYHYKKIKDQYDDDDKYKNYKTYYWLFYIYLLTNLTITISNYISFYFLVHSQFKTISIPNEDENSVTDNLIFKNKEDSLKNDINQFLNSNNKRTEPSISFANLYEIDDKNNFNN